MTLNNQKLNKTEQKRDVKKIENRMPHIKANLLV